MYTFKLETLLNHRKYEEDNLKREFALIRRNLETEKQFHTELLEKEKQTAMELKRKQENGMQSAEVLTYHRYFERLSTEIEAQAGVVVKTENQLSGKRDELSKARKNREILEKLKEKGLKDYTDKMLKKEMDFINEIAVNRHYRQNKNGE